MKIALFTDSFLPIVDGVGRVVCEYADRLSERGHEVYVICPQTDTGYRGHLGYEIVDYVSSALPMTPQYKAGVPLLDTHFRAREQMLDFDIIHAHSPGTTGIEAVLQAARRKIPLVGTFHSKYYDDIRKVTHSDALAMLGARYVAEFYRHCREVWTVSHNAEETLRTYGYKGDIRIMPNGTDLTLPSDAEASAAREAFHLPDLPILLYVGQLNFKKNLERVLNAAAMVMKSGTDCALVLAGQGPDEAALKECAKKLAIDDRVYFTGMISDPTLLRGLYRAADLFVFPSLYDTAGLVVLEAAVMETPSMVAADSAPSEIIIDGENGYICENSDAALGNAILTALSDSEKRRAVGRQARLTLPRPWDDIIDRALEVYEALIKAHQSELS